MTTQAAEIGHDWVTVSYEEQHDIILEQYTDTDYHFIAEFHAPNTSPLFPAAFKYRISPAQHYHNHLYGSFQRTQKW
ncbi:uncharacterized protein J3D65DRAFT_676157 [Phyllosticta citribraziliensis]|uniref:KTSC domain-containing protein n=1 Tax=Phyllosticta citribraziliensis TaxID=989973 RepID=A0ABR1LTC4_9PEZI